MGLGNPEVFAPCSSFLCLSYWSSWKVLSVSPYTGLVQPFEYGFSCELETILCCSKDRCKALQGKNTEYIYKLTSVPDVSKERKSLSGSGSSVLIESLVPSRKREVVGVPHVSHCTLSRIKVLSGRLGIEQ